VARVAIPTGRRAITPRRGARTPAAEAGSFVKRGVATEAPIYPHGATTFPIPKTTVSYGRRLEPRLDLLRRAELDFLIGLRAGFLATAFLAVALREDFFVAGLFAGAALTIVLACLWRRLSSVF
jgi:hypothetical protein